MPRTSVSAQLDAVAARLGRAVEALRFGPPVSHVYNPLAYASEPLQQYLRRYARAGTEALLVGMNPGPFGMVQTGIPFGEVAVVRDWLRLAGRVGRPVPEHPARPVLGFGCKRSEVSGRRLWGWARDRFRTPDEFFQRFFVWNWCPLAFLEESGRNRTPDKLPAHEREPLEALCDAALADVVRVLAVPVVVGIGAVAEARARRVAPPGVRVGRMLHPSPASPAANRGWTAQAEAALEALGVSLGPSTTVRGIRTA